MNRVEGVKNSGLKGLKTDRFLVCNKKKVEKTYETIKGEFLVQIHVQNRQKSVTPKKRKHKPKQLKPKKIRFLTEEIEKSTNDCLSVPSKTDNKASLKISCDNDPHENAYQLHRTFKKQTKKGDGNKKFRKHSEQIEEIHIQLTPLTKIKMRNQKHQSISSKKLTVHRITPGKLSKGHSKKKLLPKTDRHSQATPQPRQFLSPEMVKHQSSYCFQSQHSQEPKKMPKINSTEEKCPEQSPFLVVPKKNSLYLFDSEISAFKETSPSQLLRSTVDLLN